MNGSNIVAFCFAVDFLVKKNHLTIIKWNYTIGPKLLNSLIYISLTQISKARSHELVSVESFGRDLMLLSNKSSKPIEEKCYNNQRGQILLIFNKVHSG